MTHEVLLGVEHEVLKNFGVSGNVTWRKLNNFNWLQFDGVTGADYTQTGASGLGRAGWSVQRAALLRESVRRTGGSRPRLRGPRRLQPALLGRRACRDQAAVRPLDDADGLVHERSPRALRQPRRGGRSDADASRRRAAAQRTEQGRRAGRHADVGSGKGNFYLVLPKYQFILTGAYKAKWDINVGLNYVMRQGYATPFYRSQAPGSGDALCAGQERPARR